MAFSKSKFLTLFLLFSSFHLCLANEEPVDDLTSQSEIVGQRLPYAQDCCNYGHTTCCGNSNPPYVQNPSNRCCSGPGDYSNPPCVQNPSNKCCNAPSCQPSPTCPWQGSCPSCGCVRSNVKVEGQLESDHAISASIAPKH